MLKRKQIKEYALLHAARKVTKNDIPRPGIGPLPMPGSSIMEVTDLFMSRLLEIPIFEKRKRDIYLHIPEYPQTVKLRYRDALFYRLALILIFHFKSIQIDPNPITPEKIEAFIDTLNNLASWGKEWIALRIVDGKTFKKTLDRIARWIVRYVKYYDKRFSPEQRTQLVIDLYGCIKESIRRRKLTGEGKFYLIAHILKDLGIEKGSITQIFNRIKKAYYRKVL